MHTFPFTFKFQIWWRILYLFMFISLTSIIYTFTCRRVKKHVIHIIIYLESVVTLNICWSNFLASPIERKRLHRRPLLEPRPRRSASESCEAIEERVSEELVSIFSREEILANLASGDIGDRLKIEIRSCSMNNTNLLLQHQVFFLYLVLFITCSLQNIKENRWTVHKTSTRMDTLVPRIFLSSYRSNSLER